MALFNELQNLMVRYRFAPNKKRGQHFIVNEAVLLKIVELAELKATDTVLEIGSGTGFLTRHLQQHCTVAAVELDETLCRLLREELPEKNLQVICGDFLEVQLPRFNKVVSLPPYGHSAAIMYRLLQHGSELAVLVFQREFVEKLAALPGFKQYNALSVLTQHSFDIEIAQRLEPGCFFPKPEGESCIVKMVKTQRHGRVADKKAFSLFIKSVFRFKNKNLRNALLDAYPFFRQAVGVKEKEFRKKARMLQMQNVKVNLISVREFVQIFNSLSR